MNLRTEAHAVSELVLELASVTVMVIIGLIVLSHALHTGTADRLETVPLVGTAVSGVRVAVDAIVTPS